MKPGYNREIRKSKIPKTERHLHKKASKSFGWGQKLRAALYTRNNATQSMAVGGAMLSLQDSDEIRCHASRGQ